MRSQVKIKTGCVLGTRPEAIKMAPLIKRLQANAHFENSTVLTGQHDDLLASVLGCLQLKLDINLNISRTTASLNHLAAGILQGLEHLLSTWRPQQSPHF